MSLGKQTPGGFIPGAPTPQQIFDDILGKDSGWQNLLAGKAAAPLANAKNSEREDLEICYAKVYADPAGRRVIEDLMDQSLRRSYKPTGGFKTIEETALYAAERTGQDGFMLYVLSLIMKGQTVGDRAKKKAKRKK